MAEYQKSIASAISRPAQAVLSTDVLETLNWPGFAPKIGQ